MGKPEDFARVGDLLGDFCEGAARPMSAEAAHAQRQQAGRSQPGKLPRDDSRALAAAWPEVAGAEVAANASPVQLKAGRLVVSTSSSVWAHTLQYMGEDLRARLNERLGRGTVKEIVFRHAGWEERPRGETANRAPVVPVDVGSQTLSQDQEAALKQVEELDLPPAIRERIARAMRASFVRGQQEPVR